MRRFIIAAALVASCAATAAAQSKTITGETKTLTATIEAIERSTREVTLKEADGKYHVLTVPVDVKKFDTMKIGDTITVRYYETITIRKKDTVEKAVDTAGQALTQAGGAKPGGTAATQRTITATITEIDPNVPSITFKGPNGWTYSSRVEDKKALKQVKVGDRVDITWTEAVLMAVEPPAKNK